jgi:long-chain acyl-CoA synthetase
VKEVILSTKLKCKNWNELLILGVDTGNQSEVEDQNNVQSKIWPLSYTSGTTGRPKGVMLSHQNIVSNVLDSALEFPAGKPVHKLSYLPYL